MVWKLVVALLVVLLGREKKCGKMGNELANELANGARKAWDEYRKLPWNDRV